MKLLREVCNLPTAPFVEERVIAYAKQFASDRKLSFKQDEFGNCLIELPGRRRGTPRWVYTAHMDHPGFVADRMISGDTLRATFRGYVLGEYLRGERIRFFTPGGEVRATVIKVTSEKGSGRAQSAVLKVDKPVPPRSPGMFEQDLGRTRGRRFYCRAIDDLGGLSAALEMLDRLHRKPPACTVAVLLTRAEEEGFIGAIAAATKPKLIRKSDYLIAIETSAMQPYARQADGCIVRIGDRTSIFNSSLSYFITQAAEKLKKRDKRFKYQRALMPGGTCEATVYDVYGFQAASICIPLGNYHNMDREAKKIAPEFIDVDDWENMVKLFIAVAKAGHEYRPGHVALKARVEKRFDKLKKCLAQGPL